MGTPLLVPHSPSDMTIFQFIASSVLRILALSSVYIDFEHLCQYISCSHDDQTRPFRPLFCDRYTSKYVSQFHFFPAPFDHGRVHPSLGQISSR